MTYDRQQASLLRESGKLNFFQRGEDIQRRGLGLQQLTQASRMGDAEASYILGDLMLSDVIRPARGDQTEQALALLHSAALRGYPQARVRLNRYCQERYSGQVASALPAAADGPLTDFDGRPIHIDRKGIFVPVDAHLSRQDGMNVLRFEANVKFVYMGDEPYWAQPFEQAVLDGFCQWAGQYQVFGGQSLRVEVELTTRDRLVDSVLVIPLTESNSRDVADRVGRIFSGEKAKQVRQVMESGRSFSVAGVRRWSVRSPKLVYILNAGDRFDDVRRISAIAKHEFGHVLGLGDLYRCGTDGLQGVEKGAYRELDSYYVANGRYDLVMDDENGPISNNDIEMIVLAFSENSFQRYQPDRTGTDVSRALGRGN